MANTRSGTSAQGAHPTCAPLPPSRRVLDKGGDWLSWPYGSDHRRAIVGKLPLAVECPNVHDARILHLSNNDIERHAHLTNASKKTKKTRIWKLLELEIPQLPVVRVEVEDRDRFQYFQHTASKGLTTFGHDSTKLGNVLIRVALASNTMSAVAVRESILAFSALHRHGIHAQAVESKIAAIDALKTAAAGEIGTLEAVQHVAAGMLLSTFEIHLASCTSDDWMIYLRGVKNVIRAANLDKLELHEDLKILLDWVYYHDVLTHFSLRHWYREHERPASISVSVECTSINISSHFVVWRNQMAYQPSSSLELIELLSSLCDALPCPPCGLSAIAREECKQFLEILDWKIRKLKVPAISNTTDPVPLTMELYKLTMLVYLHRVTGSQLKQTTSVQRQIDQAFEILAQLRTCNIQLPIFIIGCEARSDQQRATILDLVAATEQTVSSRSLNHVRLLLQAIWAQDDLAEGKTNYWEKLSYVISCCTIMPTFV